MNVLILCTGNSCRSQMAEGIGNHFFNNGIKFYSAGIEKHGLNKYAMKVLEEIEIDTSVLYSKLTDEIENIDFDLVITVCDNAKEACPVYPGKKLIHKNFKDPSRFSIDEMNEEELLKKYRKTRDEIKDFLLNLEELKNFS